MGTLTAALVWMVASVAAVQTPQPDPRTLADDVLLAERIHQADPSRPSSAPYAAWLLHGDTARGEEVFASAITADSHAPLVVGLLPAGFATAAGTLIIGTMVVVGAALLASVAVHTSVLGPPQTGAARAALGAIFLVGAGMMALCAPISIGILAVLPGLQGATAFTNREMRARVDGTAAAPATRPPLTPEQQRELVALAAEGAAQGSLLGAVPGLGGWLAYRDRREIIEARVTEAMALTDVSTGQVPGVMLALDAHAVQGARADVLTMLFGLAQPAWFIPAFLGALLLAPSTLLDTPLTPVQRGAGTVAGVALIVLAAPPALATLAAFAAVSGLRSGYQVRGAPRIRDVVRATLQQDAVP